MIGQMLGPYKILDKIGGGGFATVYLGRDTRNNEVVAIKVLHEQYTEDAEFLRRFRREATALRALPTHPNIVYLRDFAEANGLHYLVMDYLEGLDLTEIIARRGRLSLAEALSITQQVAAALAAAHQAGLVHRDIKPGNIKVTPDGVVKVMDFGIARATEGTRLTRTGLFMGTPAYLAPEIWEGRPADARSDIYALGVVLYELLAGRPPFQADTPAAIMRQHLTEPLRPVGTLRRDVPSWVEDLLARMLAKEPTRRSQTAAELLAALTVGGQVAIPKAAVPSPTRVLDGKGPAPATQIQPVTPPPPSPQVQPPSPSTVQVPRLPAATSKSSIVIFVFLAGMNLLLLVCLLASLPRLRAILFTPTTPPPAVTSTPTSTLVPLTATPLRTSLPLLGTTGALISQVIPDTPAAQAGLQAGYIITAVDGTEVNTDHDLVTLIKQHKPGDEVTLKVSRGSQEPWEVKVTLGEKPGEAGMPYLGVYYTVTTPQSQPPTN